MAKVLHLEEILDQVRQLTPLEQVRLIERVTPLIGEALEGQTTPRNSMLGICKHLGSAPGTGEIDEARREAWSNFPRSDL